MPTDDLPLSPHHLQMLRASAISDAVIRVRGYRTITAEAELAALGFGPAQRRVPGLLLPLHTTDGSPGPAVYRPDNPRVYEDRTRREPDGAHPCKVIKYELPKGSGARLDCPPLCRPLLEDPSIPLWVTEGQKKADSLCSLRAASVALLGVWNFTGKNPSGGITFLADWQYIALQGRRVYIVFDSDVMKKPAVAQALARLKEHLQRKGAVVSAVYLPAGAGGAKQGVDDWLAAGGTLDGLVALAEAPRPLPKAAPAAVELLDRAPVEMRRPLALLDTPEGRRAFAAAWLPVRVTLSERELKSGEIVRLDPPQVVTSTRLFVVRDDGVIFGEGGDRDLEALPFSACLAEAPPPGRGWSTGGVSAYHSGRRADPREVFARVAAVIDRFIDFDHSLAPQRSMAEMVACWVLATWLLDAFNVAGFLWPNGDRGCGKTHLLLVVAELSYLGQVVLAGGSFASLRDMADYGATLAFDDAENLCGPRGGDPDKRALLLAGNRRGVSVPFKELAPDKTWRTRQVNAYCPRLFSATRLPDPILASRTIVVPLIRTPDRERANADPLDAAAWPHDRRALVDDLWALALANLGELTRWDAWVGEHAQLTGRNLQPWRALLAVAAWLDSLGEPSGESLFARLEKLSLGYQAERQELQQDDFITVVLQGLAACAEASLGVGGFERIRTNRSKRSIRSICSNYLQEIHSWDISSEQVAEAAREVVAQLEVDLNPEKINSRWVGRRLAKLRITRLPRRHGEPRYWRVRPLELYRLLRSYGLRVPGALDTSSFPESQDGGEITPAPDELGAAQGAVEAEPELETFSPNTFVPVDYHYIDKLLNVGGFRDPEDELWEGEL